MGRFEKSMLLASLEGSEPGEEYKEKQERRIGRLRQGAKVLNSLSKGKTVPEALEEHGVATPQGREEAFYNEGVLNIKKQISLFAAFNPEEVRKDSLKAALFKQAVGHELQNGTLRQFFKEHGLSNEEQMKALVGSSDKVIAQWMSHVVTRSKTLENADTLGGRIPADVTREPVASTFSDRKRRLHEDDQPPLKRVKINREPSPNRGEHAEEYGNNPFEELSGVEMDRLEESAFNAQRDRLTKNRLAVKQGVSARRFN